MRVFSKSSSPTTMCKGSFATNTGRAVFPFIKTWPDLTFLRAGPSLFRFIGLEAYFSEVRPKSSLPNTSVE